MILSVNDCLRRIESWARASTGEIKIVFEPPSRRIDIPCISFYACGLQDLLYRHKTTRSLPPLGFRLRFLVTSWAKTEAQAQTVLAELVFSALGEADFDVELTATDSDLWRTLEILPRPAFFLLVSIHRPRPEPILPKVTQPPRLDAGLTQPFYGCVLGPGRRPLAGARVALPGLGRAAMTDADGRFGFTGLPVGLEIREVEISARGVRRKVIVQAPVPAESAPAAQASEQAPVEPVFIHVDC